MALPEEEKVGFTGDDYQRLCALADDWKCTPEEALRRLVQNELDAKFLIPKQQGNVIPWRVPS